MAFDIFFLEKGLQNFHWKAPSFFSIDAPSIPPLIYSLILFNISSPPPPHYLTINEIPLECSAFMLERTRKHYS